MHVAHVRRFCESAVESITHSPGESEGPSAIVAAYADGVNDGIREGLRQVMAFIDDDVPPFEELKEGYARRPCTAKEAVGLLRQVADARSDYLMSCPHDDARDAVEMSVNLFRAAADVVETGAVWPWVPTWKEPEFNG